MGYDYSLGYCKRNRYYIINMWNTVLSTVQKSLALWWLIFWYLDLWFSIFDTLWSISNTIGLLLWSMTERRQSEKTDSVQCQQRVIWSLLQIMMLYTISKMTGKEGSNDGVVTDAMKSMLKKKDWGRGYRRKQVISFHETSLYWRRVFSLTNNAKEGKMRSQFKPHRVRVTLFLSGDATSILMFINICLELSMNSFMSLSRP